MAQGGLRADFLRYLRSGITGWELIPGFPGFRQSGPSRAGQALGSTRAGGKDDGSLHKLPQNICVGPLRT